MFPLNLYVLSSVTLDIVMFPVIVSMIGSSLVMLFVTIVPNPII